jgi:pimeloyl-ACP methyl ester carboxylesterase
MHLEINDATLHYDIHGQGAPLLWLHGFLGAGADWRHVFPDPPAGYQLIAPDLRGHGRSTNPSDRFSFRQAAEDVLALFDHLHLDRVRAIGLSGGGITLLHMATMRPSCVAAMAVISAPPYYPEQARAIQRHFSSEMLPAEEMTMLRARHAYGETQISRLFAQARAFADDVDDVRFTGDTLARVTAETLIVFGDRDPFYPVSLAEELYRAIPQSYLWVVPNGGHGPIFAGHARLFRDTALAFLGGAWRRPDTA